MLLDLSQPKRKQGISLTPLIDVVFILLLFFMLSSSFIQIRQIKLPASSSSEQPADKLLNVMLHSNGSEFTAQGKRYRMTDMNALRALVANHPQAVFALQVEQQVTTQMLVSLLDNFKKAGAKNVSLAGVIY